METTLLTRKTVFEQDYDVRLEYSPGVVKSYPITVQTQWSDLTPKRTECTIVFPNEFDNRHFGSNQDKDVIVEAIKKQYTCQYPERIITWGVVVEADYLRLSTTDIKKIVRDFEHIKDAITTIKYALLESTTIPTDLKDEL